MMLSPRKSSNPIAYGLAVASLALSSFSPALAQFREGPPRDPDSAGLKPEPNPKLQLEKGDATGETNPDLIERKPEVSSVQTLALSGLAAICSGVAMGWFYFQLRRKETAVSIASIGLYTLNDSLLCAASIATGQSIVGTVMMGVFAAGGLVCLHQAWRQRTGGFAFDRTDKLCVVVCTFGVGALTASQFPAITNALDPWIRADSMAMTGAVLGVLVNVIASGPLMKTFLRRPGPEEKIVDTSRGLLWAICKAPLPYLIGTTGMVASLLAAKDLTFQHLFQPVGLVLVNVTLTSGCVAWSLRRLPPAKRTADG